MTRSLTVNEFHAKIDQQHEEFNLKLEDQTTIFFPNRGITSTQLMSKEQEAFYLKYDKLIAQHNEEFRVKMSDHAALHKQKYSTLLKRHESEVKEQNDKIAKELKEPQK